MKLCPFRKKRIAVALNEWEEQFQECLQEKCAVWSGSSCGFVQVAPASLNSEVNKEPDRNSDGENAKNEDMQEAAIKVLEAKETQNPGTVRAWCQFADTGKKEAVFAKNGAGKALLSAIGKEARIKYRRMKDGTAYAVFVNTAEGE